MDFFRSYATDEKAENEGVWRKLGDCELLIARDTNENFSNAVSALYEANREALEVKGDASKELNRTIMAEAAADGLLKGWRGNVVWDGAPLEYNRENAIKMLKLPDFMRVVRRMAAEETQYRLHKEAEQGKT